MSSAALLLGCYAPPQKAHNVHPSPTTSLAQLSKDYWNHSATLPTFGNVVIEEFSVEFVDVTGELPFDSQPLLMPPPIDPIGLAIAGATQLSGVGRKSSSYTDAAMGEIAGRLYMTFVKELKQRNLAAVPIAQVTAAPDYAQLKAQPLARTTPLRYAQTMFGSDAGRVESSTTVPAPGLGVVQPLLFDAREKADRGLCNVLHAQAAMSFHLRVVVYRGCATLMQDSILRVVPARGKPVELKSKRSIVSDNVVVAGGKWEPVKGKTAPVDGTALARELEKLLPVYVDLAIGAGTAGNFQLR